MTKLTQEQLNEILDLHALWVKDNTKGKQADLSGKDISGLDLSYRKISYANFRNSNCQNANFRNSNCREADFYMANCIGTNFENANCKEADFRNSSFCGANLQDAELQEANVSCIKGKVIASTQGLQGECGRQITVLAEGEEKDWMIFCSCFKGTRKELRKWLNCKNREGYKLESTNLSISYLFKLCRMQHKQNKCLNLHKNN